MMPTHASNSGIAGVLLAAGRGRRMGCTKQLLEIPAIHSDMTRLQRGPTTAVAAAFDSIAGVCERMVVVLGHEADVVAAALPNRMFDAVRTDPDAEMLESVKIGLRTAIKIGAARGVLLHLADHPYVNPQTVVRLIETWRVRAQVVVIPDFEGRGGHPVLIPSSMIAAIVAFHGDGGLRQFWIENANHCMRMAVDDAFCVMDLDQPDDHKNLPAGLRSL